MRRLSIVLACLLGFVAVLVALAAVVLPRVEIGPFLARKATAALGRPVSIGSARLGLGPGIGVTVTDLRIATAPDTTQPAMVTLRRAEAHVGLLSLLGTPVVRALGTVNIPMGIEAGLSIVLLAIVLDRVCRAPEPRKA